MKQISILFILLTLLVSCKSEQSLEKQISEQWESLALPVNNPTLAIYQVREQGKEYDTDVSLYWKEQILQIFSRIPEIKVVARQEDLKYLMEEQRLLLSGITKSEDLAAKMGDYLSARFVLTATILPEGSLRYKLMDVADGTIVYTGMVDLPPKMVKEGHTAHLRSFPGEFYNNLIKVKATGLIAALEEYQSTTKQFRIFSAVLSDQSLKNKWEKQTEEVLSKKIIDSGFNYQINLGSTEKTFDKQKLVYKTLDYTSLYGEDPYLILFISSQMENEAVRITWSLVTHQMPPKTLYKDELVIKKD